MISYYLNKRAQQTKANDSSSKRSHVVHDVPQSSILGRLLFNIYLTDLFYESEESNISCYADDTTLHSSVAETQTVISELHIISNKLFDRFKYNHITANPGKCQLFLSSTVDVSIDDTSITASKKETFLGIIFDSVLNFDEHFSSLCNRTSKKLHVLGTIASSISFEKRKTLMEAFIEFQFNHFP